MMFFLYIAKLVTFHIVFTGCSGWKYDSVANQFFIESLKLK